MSDRYAGWKKETSEWSSPTRTTQQPKRVVVDGQNLKRNQNGEWADWNDDTIQKSAVVKPSQNRTKNIGSVTDVTEEW